MILIINSPNPVCGVHQFGYRLYWLADKAGMDVKHVCPSSYAELVHLTNELKPDVVVFNWHLATLQWISPQLAKQYKKMVRRMGIIPHNKNYWNEDVFDFVIYDDSNFTPNGKWFKLDRVILPFDKKYDVADNIIGFFGFLFPHKNLNGLADKVAEEFPEGAVLRLHIPPHEHSGTCLKESLDHIKKYKNITVDLSENMVDFPELIDWLAHNTINVFPYHQTVETSGQSTTTDFALSAKRPISVSRTTIFSHLHKNEIIFEENTLPSIIARGLEPLEEYYTKWSVEKYIDQFKTAINL